MGQEIILNAHNKQRCPPLRTTGFYTLLIRLFVLVFGLLTIGGCASKNQADGSSDTLTMGLTESPSDLLKVDRLDAKVDTSTVEYTACTLISHRDTNTYKDNLNHLKHYIEDKMDVPALVLCDAAPRSCDEANICYRLTEEEWVVKSNVQTSTLFTMNDWLSRYAMADSSGAFEAFMLYCEFVDGYLAESAFDWLIALEEKYPARFAQSRKNRTEYWNAAFDEWKLIMAD